MVRKEVADSEFLDRKTKKKWVEESGERSFMLYARSLAVTWGNDHLYHWTWKCFKETGKDNVEVAKLMSVCWVDVRGKFSISELTSGTTYEVLFKIKLTESAFGWELPVTLELSLPNEPVRRRQVSLCEKPKGKEIELNVGNFLAEEGERGEVNFFLKQHGGHWKNGLILYGVIIRPMKNCVRATSDGFNSK